MDSTCWQAFWQFMLVNWKDEAVFLVQEAMPVAFWKPVCGIGVASPQFISIKVGFSVHANGSEKLLSDRKKYSIKKGKSGQSFLLTALQSAELHLGLTFISVILPVSDASLHF